MADLDAPSQAGFTLVEVIVSFVILAMVLGSATLSVAYSARLDRQAEEKRLAVECAERVIAERFSRLPGAPLSETGADQDCRWRITRKAIKPKYTESGRGLVAFRLEVLGETGRTIETFDTYYVEAPR